MQTFKAFIVWLFGTKQTPQPQPLPHYSYMDNVRCMVVDLSTADIEYYNSLRDWR